MAKKSKRRSVSVRANTYERLFQVAEREGRGISAIVEQLAAEYCRNNYEPEISIEDAMRVQAKRGGHNRAEREGKQNRRQVEASDVSKHFPGPYG